MLPSRRRPSRRVRRARHPARDCGPGARGFDAGCGAARLCPAQPAVGGRCGSVPRARRGVRNHDASGVGLRTGCTRFRRGPRRYAPLPGSTNGRSPSSSRGPQPRRQRRRTAHRVHEVSTRAAALRAFARLNPLSAGATALRAFARLNPRSAGATALRASARLNQRPFPELVEGSATTTGRARVPAPGARGFDAGHGATRLCPAQPTVGGRHGATRLCPAQPTVGGRHGATRLCPAQPAIPAQPAATRWRRPAPPASRRCRRSPRRGCRRSCRGRSAPARRSPRGRS